MTQRNRRLLLEFTLAIAVCGAIALFDRVLIGLVGAGVCTVIFAARFLVNAAGGVEAREIEEPRRGTADRHEDIVGRDPSRCYNPDNPVLPIYYPTERQD